MVLQSYDAIGRLCAVGASGSTCTSGTTYASSYAYNAAFQVTGLNYGNGVTAAFGYTADRLLLQSLAYTKGSTTLFSTNYWYKTDSTNCPNGAAGNNGQIQCITDNVDSGRTPSYSYDSLYRLTNATTNGPANYPKWGLSMTYDRYGNRSAQSISSGCVAPMTCPTSSVTVSASTNQITGSPYAYDANGNMTNDGSNTLVYDAENRLLSATNGSTSGAYSYDGNNLRVKKVSGSTTTVSIFSGSKVIAEYDNGAAVGSPSREYIYSGAALLARIDSTGTKYYHQDHLSNRLLTDSNGNKLAEMGHYPFGESWYGTSSEKWLFTSYERDAESGNDYAMMRFHVNRLARFSSPDLLAGSIGSPQSLNRFTYTLNDPGNLIDPFGLDCFAVDNGFFCDVSFGSVTVTADADPDPGASSRLAFGASAGDTGPPPLLYKQHSGRGGFLKRIASAVCSIVPDAVTISGGFDVGAGVAAGEQAGVFVNGASGEVSAFITENYSGGIIAPDAYVAGGLVFNAPTNSSLNTPPKTLEPGFAVAGERAGAVVSGNSFQFTAGPSFTPITLVGQGSRTLVSKSIPYLGYLLYPQRAACKAITGH